MKRSHLLILAVIIFMTACTPSAVQVAESATATAVPTSTLPPTATSTPVPTATIAPTPTALGGGSGDLVFTYNSDDYQSMFPDLEGQRHVFITNLNGTNRRVLSEGMGDLNFVRSVSPDGRKLLIAAFNTSSPDSLYILDLSKDPPESAEVVDDFSHPTISSPARWIDNQRFVYWGNGAQGMGIYRVDLDGSEPQRIDAASAPYEGLLAVNEENVYWYSRVYKNYGSRRGDYRAVWWTKVDGSAEGRLESEGRQAEYFLMEADFSPDGKRIAWIPSAPEPECDTVEKIMSFDRETKVATCDKIYVADLADMDNPLKISLAISSGAKPQLFENIGSKYYVYWSNDNRHIYLQSRGVQWAPELLFAMDLGSENPGLVWLENLPALGQDSQVLGGKPSGLVGFSPDGRIGLLKVNTWEDTKETALIDMENMQVLNYILGDLNQDGISALHWLP